MEEIYRDKPTTHDTFLIGFNDKNQVIFLKSYDYIKQKEECQSNSTWVQNNCAYWELGTMQEFIITHEDSSHEIIIPHP